MKARIYLLTAAILGMLAVAAGAFGAHALERVLEEGGTTNVWDLAVLYQFLHAIGLLGLGVWKKVSPGNQRLDRVYGFWLAGVILFSGSLYILSLGGPRLLGPVTPAGGICLLIGWALLAHSAWVEE